MNYLHLAAHGRFLDFLRWPTAFGIQVDEIKAEDAIEKVADIHTSSRLAAIETAELDGSNQHKL